MIWLQRLGALGRQVLVPPRTRTERNTYYLYAEVVFAALLGAAGSFHAAYILRLGGSNTLVGLLSSLPSLLAIFLFIPSARILERQTQYLPWIVGSLLAARAGFVVMLSLPLFLRSFLPEASVAVLVAITIPSVFFSTGWSPLLSDVVPPRSRATVLAWRSILSSGAIAPLIYLMGRWLDRGRFPMNYQWMYAISFVAAAYSVYLISRIEIPEAHAPPVASRKEPWFGGLVSALRENRGFARIVANTFLFDFGAWLVGPLYIIFFVRELGASDGWIGLNGTLAHVGVILGYWLWRRIIRRTGESKALLIALPLASIYAFMVGLLPNLTFVLFASFLINVINPGVGLSHGVIFLDLLPEGKKHSSTAIYSTILNIGAFVGPLIGVALSSRIGIVATLFIGGGMRLAGAFLFYFFPVRASDAQVSTS